MAKENKWSEKGFFPEKAHENISDTLKNEGKKTEDKIEKEKKWSKMMDARKKAGHDEFENTIVERKQRKKDFKKTKEI